MLSSLRNDAIRVENNALQRGLLSVSSPQDNVDVLNIIPRLQCVRHADLTARFTWNFVDMPETVYNDYDEDVKTLIQEYKTTIPVLFTPCPHPQNGTVLLPVVALRMLRQLLALSNNRLVFLSGDVVRIICIPHPQGTRVLAKLSTSRNPYITTHGSFSMPANLHALDCFVKARGGTVFASPYLEGFIVGAPHFPHPQNSVYVMGINPALLTTTRWMIHHEFSTFTPESFNVTQKCLKEESSPSPSVAAVIAVLRLAHFDTDVFMRFKQVLIERGGYAGSAPSTRKDILYDLDAVRTQYYPIKSTADVCFELARIHMGIKVGI